MRNLYLLVLLILTLDMVEVQALDMVEVQTLDMVEVMYLMFVVEPVAVTILLEL